MLSTSKPSPWSFVEFKANSSVTLRHWVKGSKELIGDTPKESPYSKFNQHLSIPSFTKEEYEAFMNENEGTQKSVESEKTITKALLMKRRMKVKIAGLLKK